MSCLKTWDLKCIKRGDTLKEKILTFPFDINGCTFLMQFRKYDFQVNDNPVVFEWKSEDDSFEIIDSVLMKLNMEKKIMEFEPDKYISDFQITYPNGDVETLFEATLIITKDYSRP